MRTQLGWRNLLHRKLRTLVSILGVSFPVVPVFVHLGLYDAMMKSATLNYDQLDFDLALVSRDYSFFSKPGDFDRTRLYQALGDPEVETAQPLYIAFHLWRNPHTRSEREILLMAIDPRHPPFRSQALKALAEKLKEPDTVLFDRLSRPEYGSMSPGLVTEIGGRRIRVLGLYEIGTGFAALGGAMAGDQTLESLIGGAVLNRVNVGLISIREGSRPDAIGSRLGAILAPDVRVLTRRQLEDNERAHWSRTTSLGAILAFGLAVAFLVGTIILYQILFTDVSRRLPEFATLRAIGFGRAYVRRIVLQQAACLTLGGFVPGYFISLGVYRLTVLSTGLPMAMTKTRVALVFLCTVGIGCAGGLLAVRKAQQADPADLFK